jgi:hypothetical protein
MGVGMVTRVADPPTRESTLGGPPSALIAPPLGGHEARLSPLVRFGEAEEVKTRRTNASSSSWRSD